MVARPIDPCPAWYTSRLNEAATKAHDIKSPYDPSNKTKSLQAWGGNTYTVQTMMNAWMQAVQTRQQYQLVSMELHRMYMFNRLLNLVVTDVINPDPNGKILDARSKDPKVQERLNQTMRRINFNVLAERITPQLFEFGEYAVALESNDQDSAEMKGLVRVRDKVDQNNILAFYENGAPVKYLRRKLGDNTKPGTEWVMASAKEYAHFVIGTKTLRTHLDDIFLDASQMVGTNAVAAPYTGTMAGSIPDKLKNDLPDYVWLGQPTFFPVLQKLRELQVLDSLVPAAKLNEVLQQCFVGINFQMGTDFDAVAENLLRYEDMLNPPVAVNKSTQQLTFAEIIGQLGRIKPVPIFGDGGGKGSMTPINARASVSVDDLVQAAEVLRRLICTSIGVPPSLMFGSAVADGDKTSEIRMFGAYARLLAAVQLALKRGFKQMFLVDLWAAGFNQVTADDIDIVFLQSIVDLSGLEKMEFDDAKQEIVMRKMDYIERLYKNPLIAKALKPEAVINYIKVAADSLTPEESMFVDDLNALNLDPDEIIALFSGPIMVDPEDNSIVPAPSPFAGGADDGSSGEEPPATKMTAGSKPKKEPVGDEDGDDKPSAKAKDKDAK